MSRNDQSGTTSKAGQSGWEDEEDDEEDDDHYIPSKNALWDGWHEWSAGGPGDYSYKEKGRWTWVWTTYCTS